MNSIYILLKPSQVTQAMINKSTSKSADQLPIYTAIKPFLIFFSTSEDFTVLEIPYGIIHTTNLFDSYVWLNRCEMEQKVIELTQG